MREKLFANGKWYYSLPILTVGLFAWVPFLHAAAKTHRAEPRKLAIIYGVVAVVLASLSTLTQSDAEVPFGPNLSTLVTLLIITSVAYACYRLHPLRVAVYGLDDPHEVAPTASQQAVALALGDRATVTRPGSLPRVTRPWLEIFTSVARTCRTRSRTVAWSI